MNAFGFQTGTMMNQNFSAMHQGMGPMGVNVTGNMTSHAGMANMPGVMGSTGIEGFLASVFTTVLPLLFWALIIAGTIFLVRGLWDVFKNRKHAEAKSVVSEAAEILKLRLAKGEISREEYESMKEVLA